MNSRVIPKEELTAYQRWELAAFEDGRGGRPGGAQETPAVKLPTAEELERLQQQAWNEGHRLGQEEGRAKGFEAGRKEGQAEVQRLRAIADALETERLRQDETIAREVLELALAVARQMVRASLSVKPELILNVIQEAIASLPSVSSQWRIVVHPRDAALVREWLAGEHSQFAARVLEDEQLAPGGFRMESSHGELDGALADRWREIVDRLGADSKWLE